MIPKIFLLLQIDKFQMKSFRSIPTILQDTNMYISKRNSSQLYKNSFLVRCKNYNNFICAKNIQWNVYMQIGCQQGRTQCSYKADPVNKIENYIDNSKAYIHPLNKEPDIKVQELTNHELWNTFIYFSWVQHLNG